MTHQPRAWGWAAGVGLAIALGAAPVAAIGIGERAPEFSLADLHGSAVSLGGLRGKVVLLDFWASWCEPCREEFPVLERLQHSYGEHGLVVVALTVDRDRANVRRFLDRNPASFAIVHDPAGSVAARYQPPRMPSAFLIDRRGVVRYVQSGYEPSDAPRIESQIRHLLGL